MKKDEELSPELYEVARKKGTETPFSGKYWDSPDRKAIEDPRHSRDHEKGMYKCAICGTKLFSSDTKFDSGTGWPLTCVQVRGWPSFTQPLRFPMQAYVYVLKMNNGQLYVGSTRNLDTRIKEHKSGAVSTTKKYLPVALIYYEWYLSEKDAREREKMLKQHGSSLAHLKARITDSLEISRAGFTEPANLENVELKEDLSGGMTRAEVLCKKCGAHLGHVFDGGPTEFLGRLKHGQETTTSRDKGGKRYCINSVCLELQKDGK